MKSVLIVIGAVVLAAVIVGAIFGLAALVFMVCWNAAMPTMFGLVTITFWQSVAFLVLINMVSAALGLRRQQKASGKK
jgi:uncharacterized RDD family membrane protein YckC